MIKLIRSSTRFLHLLVVLYLLIVLHLRLVLHPRLVFGFEVRLEFILGLFQRLKSIIRR